MDTLHSNYKYPQWSTSNNIKGNLNETIPEARLRLPNQGVWSSPFESGGLSDINRLSAIKGAISAATEAEAQVTRGLFVAKSWMPSILFTLKRYFAVSHTSVCRKLLAFFVPPLGYRYIWKHNGDNLRYSDHQPSLDVSSQSVDNSTHSNNGIHNIDHLGPDLYLPLMSMTSYILLCGLAKGTLDIFHPTVLSTTASYATGIIIIESLLTIAVLHALGMGYLPYLDIVSMLSTKFQGLVVSILCGLFASSVKSMIFWVGFVYTSFCVVHATYKSWTFCENMNRPQSEWGSYSPVSSGFTYFALVSSLLQIPLCWILTPSIVSK